MRCRYVGETETKGRNYTSRYFSRCNQSDYVSRGRLTVTFAALENVETRTEPLVRARRSASFYLCTGWSDYLNAGLPFRICTPTCNSCFNHVRDNGKHVHGVDN